MPDRKDLYAENITKIYANMVEIEGKLDDGKPINIYLNDSGVALNFKGHEFMPCAFQVTPPDRNNLEENSGTLTVVGVLQQYMEMIQRAVGDIFIRLSLVRTDELDYYILAPVEFKVDSITVNSANASVTLNLKSGGSLGYNASVKSFDTNYFPGLNG